MCFNPKSGTELEIEILPDGTVKVLTGSIAAGAAHLRAAEFMSFLERELGAAPEVEKRAKSAHTHAHAHGRIKH